MPITMNHFLRIKMWVFKRYMRRRKSSVLADDEKEKSKVFWESMEQQLQFSERLISDYGQSEKIINE